MADMTRAARDLFGGNAEGEITFAAVVTTLAAMVERGQIGLRVETLRDEDHMRAFKDGVEPLDGLNLSLDVETAIKLRDQLTKVLASIARN